MNETEGTILGILKTHGGRIRPSDIRAEYGDNFAVMNGTRAHDSAKTSAVLHIEQGISLAIDDGLAAWEFADGHRQKMLVLTGKGIDAVGGLS